MNWKAGQGLGKEGQGEVEIIPTLEKNDTMGLGYTPAEVLHAFLLIVGFAEN